MHKKIIAHILPVILNCAHRYMLTVISILQGISGCKAPPPKFGSEVNKSTDKTLPKIRCNCGGVIAKKQNMINASSDKWKRCCVVTGNLWK